jgi:hypothetical protein
VLKENPKVRLYLRVDTFDLPLVFSRKMLRKCLRRLVATLARNLKLDREG